MMSRQRFLPIGLLFLLLATQIVWAEPDNQQVANLAAFTNELRADLEIAANAQFGQGARPDGWTNNIDRTTPTYVPDLWYDKELLANEIFGEDVRPPDWFGLTVNTEEVIARNTRHDLEILADNIYNGTDNRPPVWTGASARYRCERDVQNADALLSDFFGFQTTLADDAFGYCVLLQDEIRTTVLEVEALDITDEAILNEEILAVRGDIERIANEVYGVNDRPLGWSGNTDITSPLLLTDNYEDLRLLADETLGTGVRPEGYLGAITDSPLETWRNLRHDLELLADVVVPTLASVPDRRPRGWQGLDPLRRCNPLTQDMVLTLEARYAQDTEQPFSRVSVTDDENYCANMLERANQFAEERPPTETERLALVAADNFTYEAEYAFSYLDTAALEFVGVMPLGTRFKAWYRSYGDSTMMFISGQDFALYVDRRWTTMPQDVFDRLPTLEGVRPLAFCDASWCDGPGPTPTPTGSAIESLLAFATPEIQPTQDPALALPPEQKTQVNFENVRIIYLQDNVQTRTARVTLDLCEEAQLLTCEAVLRVTDSATGDEIPVVAQNNGASVYELSYGYTDSIVIESATLISNDIFVSDPTLPRN